MTNVFITEFDGNEDAVMLFTEFSANQIERFFKLTGHTFGEVYEVPGRDLQFYLYDPVHVSASQHKHIDKTLREAKTTA